MKITLDLDTDDQVVSALTVRAQFPPTTTADTVADAVWETVNAAMAQIRPSTPDHQSAPDPA